MTKYLKARVEYIRTLRAVRKLGMRFQEVAPESAHARTLFKREWAEIEEHAFEKLLPAIQEALPFLVKAQGATV